MRRLVPLAVGLLALGFAASAAAKDFDPGDLSVCNATRCVPLTDRSVLPLVSRFYYSPGSPARVRAPRLGARAYELRFSNGYVTGIVATSRLDRFLSYGVNLERFRRGRWYRVPPGVAGELRALARRLHPLRVTRTALSKSH